MRVSRIAILIACLATLSNLSMAQQNGNATAVGFPEGGHFTGSEVESVQVNNGNLHVQIPLWALPGRGVTPDAAFIYDSKGWYPSIVCGDYTCSYSIASEPGNTMQMSINASSASSTTIQLLVHQTCGTDTTKYDLASNRIYREPNGTKHHMVPDPISTSTGTDCWPASTTVQYADDGSGWNASGSKSGGVPGVFDTNGNSVGTTDTMGRPYNPTSGSYYDSTGTLHDIPVVTEDVAISTHLCFPSPDQNGNMCAEYTGTWTVPHIITLPNGLTYTIEYVQNDEGEISSITFPTGATVSYEYSNAPTYDFGGKQVTKRTVTVNGQQSIWQYTYTGGGSEPSITTMIDPLQNKTIYTCTPYTPIYSSESPSPNFPCVITKEQYYDNGGNLIKTVDIGFNPAATGAMLPTSRTTTWAATNQVSKVETDYEAMTIGMFPDGVLGPTSAPITWGNVSETREYDWGIGTPGPLLRRTTYTYLHTDTTVNPNPNQALYLAKNIADRPTSKTVRDGAGNIISQTKYYYDEGALTPTSNAVGHDYTNYGPTNLLRGNLTRVSKWSNTTGTWLDTMYTYDDLGNKRTSTDPNTHTTTYDYTDRFSGASCNTTSQPSNALPTLITDAKGYRIQKTYYQCTSQLQNQKDENDLQYGHPGTSYTYDLVDRLLTVTHSDGGTISTSYQDSVPLEMTTTTTVTGTDVPSGVTANLQYSQTALLDGLGRVVQTQTNKPEGTEFVDTTYDLMGRVDTVSNPHHSDPNPALDGVTTYAYDALGRTISVTHPDGSVLTTQYTGTATETIDEGNGNGSQRVARVNDYDGLDRLISVCEVSGSTLSGSNGNTPVSCGQAIPATGFLTSYQYTYDSSGYSYVSVAQAGLNTRSFKYDSLGQLISAFNPEAGTTTYTYNNDGLVVQRTRPKANQTGSAVTTTTYSYDELHRLLSESYDDGSTPANYYCYDEQSAWGRTLTNTYGRKTRSLVGATCTTPSGTPYVAGELFSYDSMGRVIANDQCTPSMCGTTQKTFDYTYHDYLGGELTATDGMGNTFTANPDSVGRLSSAFSSLQDANHPGTLFTNAVYGVFGLTSANIGPSMTEAITQQNRGWTQSITAANLTFDGYATGQVQISGTEQSQQQQTQAATASSASITLSGSGRQKKVWDSDCSCYDWITDGGDVYVIVGGYKASGSYSSASDTSSLVASRLATSLNASASPVTATVSASTVTITSKATGAAANYSLSYGTDYDTADWSTPAFTFTTAPSTMSGGQDAVYTTVYDQGTATVTVNGHSTTTPQWGSGSTAATVAQDIVNAVNGDAGAYVTASLANGAITLQAKVAGTAGQYSYSVTTTAGTGFSTPSFSASASGTSLNYGAYIVSIGHAPNGDVVSANDTVNGNWTYTYDEFNRLTAASDTTTSLSWNYDRFGNRWKQNVLAGSAVATSNSYDQNNHDDAFTYDASGNVLDDGINEYNYDAEGRIVCTVSDIGGGSCTSTTGVHYAYDADGLRVARYSGTTLLNQYLYNLNGQMVTELDGSNNWVRGEVFVRGTYLATYFNGTTTFAHSDWLGTVRYRTNLDGSQAEACISNPYGDGLACTGTDPSNKHFTGKLRDQDTGLDYFGARYYASVQGRFLTPDWSATPEAVPYGHFEIPQSLNLYAYVKNNPVTDVDVDGHDPGFQAPDPTFDPRNNGGKGPADGNTAEAYWGNESLRLFFIMSGMSADEAEEMANGSPSAQQQNSNSTDTTNPNASAEQHQYDLVVNRTNKLLGTDDAADHIDPDGKLDGGNYAFPINHNDKSDDAFQRSLNKALGEATGDTGAHGGLTPPTHRIGFSTSLHHDNDALHVDHFNGAKFPVGTLLHAIVDVGIGHLMGPNFAFSYSGVQQ